MNRMIATAGVGLLAMSSAAGAVPLVNPGEASSPSLVEPAAAWRYNANCGWRGGRWVVDLGAGKLVVCRPNRPGREWAWHREGGREGWWDGRKRVWHNQNW